MIKVLHIVTRVDTGGISSMIYNYYSHLNTKDIHFDIVAIDTGVKQGYHEKFESLGMRVFYMPEKILPRLLFLIALIRKERYNVVHSHIELQSAVYLLIAKICGVKTRVAHTHQSSESKGFKNSFLRYLLNKVVTKRLGASDLSIRAAFGTKYEIKATVLNNAIDVQQFSFDPNIRTKYRNQLNISDQFVIGFVGRLSYVKNINYLVKVFAEIEKRYPKVLLLVVGDGESYNSMNELLHSLDLLSKVRFLKNRDDVNALMMAMDIMLLPSFNEGLGMVLVEAQSTSLMCIVSAKVPKLVALTDYITYKGIEDADINDWVDTALKYTGGYERKPIPEVIIQKHFSIEHEAGRLIDLYRS